MNRRQFLQSGGVAMLAGWTKVQAQDEEAVKPRFSVRWGDVPGPGVPVRATFQVLKDLGFDGVELDSQFLLSAAEVKAAQEATGLPVHGIVNANQWSLRLSDPTADLRRKAVEELQAGIRYAKEVGAATLEVLPGAVRNPLDENHAQVEERSAAALREVLPLAESCQVKLAVCHTSNGFYVPSGPGSAVEDALAGWGRFLDAFASPWIGASLHCQPLVKNMAVAPAIQILGKRMVGCHVPHFKDPGRDLSGLRETLAAVRYGGWIGVGGRGLDRKGLGELLAQMKGALTPA